MDKSLILKTELLWRLKFVS